MFQATIHCIDYVHSGVNLILTCYFVFGYNISYYNTLKLKKELFVCFTIFFYYFNYFQGAQTRYTIVSFGLNQPLVDTPMHTRLWSFGSSTQFCLIFKQCYLLLSRHLQFLVFQKCGYMYLMCDTTIICLFSYLVYLGDLVPFLWEINCSYNKLFKKDNKYADP